MLQGYTRFPRSDDSVCYVRLGNTSRNGHGKTLFWIYTGFDVLSIYALTVQGRQSVVDKNYFTDEQTGHVMCYTIRTDLKIGIRGFGNVSLGHTPQKK